MNKAIEQLADSTWNRVVSTVAVFVLTVLMSVSSALTWQLWTDVRDMRERVTKVEPKVAALEDFARTFTQRADAARSERVQQTQIITNQITAIQENLNGVNKSVDRLIFTVDRLNDKLQDERAPK